MAFNIGNLFVKLGLKSDGFEAGMNKAEKKTSTFEKTVKKVGAAIVAAFALDRVIAFGKELVDLALKAEGVKTAFDKINRSVGLLNDLKGATRGTVDELRLMQLAIQAKNFKIPLDELAGLLEFATNRAIETGESVDYLTNSIITGLGRKSTMILDNLGLSIIEIQEEFEITGDFAEAVGNIIQREMEATGKVLDTTGVKVARANASWTDLKTTWGEFITTSRTVSFVLNKVNDDLKISNSSLKWYEKAWYRITMQHGKGAEAAEKLQQELDAAAEKADDAVPDPVKITTVTERISQLRDEIKLNNSIIGEGGDYTIVVAAIDRVKELQAELDKLSPKLKKTSIEVGDVQLTNMPKMQGLKADGVDDDYTPKLGDMSNSLNAKAMKELAIQEAMVAEFVANINGMMEAGVEDLIGTFAEGIGQLASGNIGMEEFFNAILATVGSFLSQMGKMLIAYGIAMEAFKEAFKTPLAAIAAGIALVAIGGLIGGLASKGPAGSSSSSGVSASGGNSISSGGYNTSQASVEETFKFELEGTTLIAAIRSTERRNISIR